MYLSGALRLSVLAAVRVRSWVRFSASIFGFVFWLWHVAFAWSSLTRGAGKESP